MFLALINRNKRLSSGRLLPEQLESPIKDIDIIPLVNQATASSIVEVYPAADIDVLQSQNKGNHSVGSNFNTRRSQYATKKQQIMEKAARGLKIGSTICRQGLIFPAIDLLSCHLPWRYHLDISILHLRYYE